MKLNKKDYRTFYTRAEPKYKKWLKATEKNLNKITDGWYLSPKGRIADYPGGKFFGQLSVEDQKKAWQSMELMCCVEDLPYYNIEEHEFQETPYKPQEKTMQIITNTYYTDNGRIQVNEVVIIGA